jgi:GNAT superfamily N-acetyltransferase
MKSRADYKGDVVHMARGLADIELSVLRPGEISLAAGMAARGMRDNPFSVALFGDVPGRRVRGLEPMFHWMLASLQGASLVARRRGAIVGIAVMSPPDQCFYRQTVAQEKTLSVAGKSIGVLVPRIPWRVLMSLLAMGPGAIARISAWGEAGMKHDPPEPHQHVELVVVEAGLQGLGIGRLMMEELCRQIDTAGAVSYLETDKPENVRFYEQFGFAVVEEATVLQTRSWYMERRTAR